MVGIGLTLVVAFGIWIWRRPNRAEIDSRLGLESWPAVDDGLHDSNTDLLHWRGAFWLVHAASPWHLGSARCRLVLRRSTDARTWQEVAELRLRGQDIRDPKFALIGGRLHLYALANRGLSAKPHRTVLATSEDGEHWSELRPVEITNEASDGWLLWRPKTQDGKTWWVAAYASSHGRSILLRSEDGVRFERVSTIWDGDGNDETDVEWLRDGRLLATARLEVTPDALLGNARARTGLALAAPPYTEWRRAESMLTRLDGPALFAHAGRIYAVARFQPPPFGPLTRMASTLARKRTALYVVEPDRLVRLSDLPSSGDTSYAGVALHEGALWISYYTSDPTRDWPWLLGMFLPSQIRMARIPLERLEALAGEKMGAETH